MALIMVVDVSLVQDRPLLEALERGRQEDAKKSEPVMHARVQRLLESQVQTQRQLTELMATTKNG
jgi:hypothetical protein